MKPIALVLTCFSILASSNAIQAGDFKKPDKYPADAVAGMKDAFAEESYLTQKRFDEIIPAWKALVDYAKKHEASWDNPTGELMTAYAELMTGYVYKDWVELTRSITITTTCLGILQTLGELENLKSENQMAYQMSKSMVSGMITGAMISESDLKFVYDNWDEAVGIMEEMEAYADEQ